MNKDHGLAKWAHHLFDNDSILTINRINSPQGFSLPLMEKLKDTQVAKLVVV